MTTPKLEVFSRRVTTGRRSYFLDVEQLDDASRYLSTREVRHRGEQDSPPPRVIVAEEDLGQFRNGLEEVLAFLRAGTSAAPGKLAEMRRIHPRAYTPWQAEDDGRLRAGFARGEEIEHLATVLQRQPSAIRSRLQKLGLMSG